MDIENGLISTELPDEYDILLYFPDSSPAAPAGTDRVVKAMERRGWKRPRDPNAA